MGRLYVRRVLVEGETSSEKEKNSMWGMLWKALTWYLRPTGLNRGEKDQPPLPEVRIRHLEAELEQARRDEVAECAREKKWRETYRE